MNVNEFPIHYRQQRLREDHYLPHQPFWYMEAEQTLLPASDERRFFYLRRSSTSPYDYERVKDKNDVDVSEYVFAEHGLVCVLPGEIVPVWWNHHRRRIEIIGSHGLIRLARVDDTTVADDADGTAYILDQTMQDLSSVSFKNKSGITLNQDDHVWLEYIHQDETPRWFCRKAGSSTALIVATTNASFTTGDNTVSCTHSSDILGDSGLASDTISVKNSDNVFEGDNGDSVVVLAINGEYAIIQKGCP